jgi:HK97 family phage portal protein
MGLINSLLEQRTVKTSISEPWQWPSLANFLSTTNQSNAGVSVDEQKALKLSVVYACVRLISDTIGMLPLALHQENADGGSRVAMERKLNKVLYRMANPYMTTFLFKQTMQAHLLLWGNAYAEKIVAGNGDVLELWPMAPWNVKVELVENVRRYTYKMPDGTQRYIQENKVFHIPGLSFDGVQGYSPISVMRNEIGLGLALQDFGSKYFQNGTNLGGYLEHPGKLGDKARIHLKEDLQENFQGISNALRMIVLEEGMKYQKIGIPANDAQFIESRKFQLEEIARYFGVQLHMIQNLDRATNNNIEQQSIEFKTYAIQPWAVRWEQEIYRSLLTPEMQDQNYYAKYNMNSLMRGDYKTRMEGYRTGVQMGLYSLNDVRRLEDMNPIDKDEGGDIHWVNSAMIPIDKQMNFESGGGTNEETASGTADGTADD